MSRARADSIAIIGSGPAGTAFALTLVEAGYDVDIFEKGPTYPYPHAPQFQNELRLWRDSAHEAPADIADLTSTGDYGFPLNRERAVAEGGAGTHWSAIALRMRPSDFRTRTLSGIGEDWAVDYDQLEPWYGRAERMIGVSGTDEDNPFAPPRSTPHPLPAFEFGPQDMQLAARLEAAGIHLHTTPQARTRYAFDDRPACQNFGKCSVCPVGARYSPNHHLARLRATGRCRIHTDTSVRRIITDGAGRATGLLVQHNDEQSPREHPARWIVLAGGALESIRLLLLSTGSRWPDGLGNERGRVGHGLAFHHYWWSDLRFDHDVLAGRFGGYTGQTHQFMDPRERGRHGGIKVEFGSTPNLGGVGRWGEWSEIEPQIMLRRRSLPLVLSAETVADGSRHVTLSRRADRFGDPFAHVHYELVDYDFATFQFAARCTAASPLRQAPATWNSMKTRSVSGRAPTTWVASPWRRTRHRPWSTRTAGWSARRTSTWRDLRSSPARRAP
jgi:glucose dehydrogenase